MIETKRTNIETEGHCDIIDITGQVSQSMRECRAKAGTITVFVRHSTCGITIMEYEPGLIADLKAAFERLAPQEASYEHDRRWGDGNGFSHVRASLLGTSQVIPFSDGQLLLGTWQQVVLIDFDNRPRIREIIFQIAGE